MIVFALIGLIVCAQYIIRWLKIRKQRSLEKEKQTEPARPVRLPKVTTKGIGIQTEGSAIPVKAGSSPKRMEAKASRQAASSGQQASSTGPGGAGTTTLPKAAAMPQLRDRSGVRYHRETCGVLRVHRGRSRQVSRGVAIQRGCRLCH